MSRLKPLHVSHSCMHGDGGIAFAVADLLASQQSLGIYSRWLTADRYPALRRDQLFTECVLQSDASVLHCHGLWRTQTRVAMTFINHGYPLIVSPHGMLDAWAMAHSSWKKEIVWRLWEGKVLASSACVHALCDAEAHAIHQRLPNKPVAVIPNGVHPAEKELQPRDLLPWVNEIPENENVLLFLGRFHQKKGLEPLMTAWQSVLDEAQLSGWWLVFLGFGDDGKFESQLRGCPVNRCRAYGPIFGKEKVAALQHSSAFILPSYSEGLPMAALEAMAYGLPCLLSSACNIPEAFSARAAFRAEPDASELIRALKNLFSSTASQRYEMGINGKNLTSQHFHWAGVAQQMSELYRWIQGIGPLPLSVRIPE